MWGEEITLTKTSLNTGDGYDSGAEKDATIGTVDFTYKYLMTNGSNIQAKASDGEWWNTTIVPGKITNVSATHSGTARSSNLYWGTSAKPTTSSSSVSGSFSNNSPSGCFGYVHLKRSSNVGYWSQFVITYTPATITPSTSSISGLNYNVGSGPSASQSFTVSGSEIPANLVVTAPTNFEVSLDNSSWGSSKTISVTTSGSTGGQLSLTTVHVRLASGKSAGNYNGNVSIKIYGSNDKSGTTPKTVAVSGTVTAASCEANPTIGNASLNGSISLSSIPLSISSVGGGTDCTLAEYGFVWKASSAPSASDNKTKIGESSSATSFTGNITGSFSTGVTYYIKGYAINNGPNTTLSSTALTITPQSVTFNSNGGSSVSTAYVNNGATVSKPSNPTKTGYTFGTWQLSGSDYNFSTTVTDNITLDATWNAKTTAITLNKNNDDASGSTAGSASYTYGESTKNSYTAATRTNYSLDGYYTTTSGGTKILNADGTLAGDNISVSTTVYTSSGNWAYDNTSLTLYAQWTPTYTVTYDGNDNTGGSVPTDATVYNSGTTVTVKSNSGSLVKTGWTFAGWNTNATGTGTNYTAGSGTFSISANTTLYAKWTCTVTWSVNKATNVYSAQTVTYNSSGCKVASVPSGSDLDLENDYCGDKFMGWTSDENYVHGTSNLFTNVAGSPNITGDITFYAVFADYGE